MLLLFACRRKKRSMLGGEVFSPRWFQQNPRLRLHRLLSLLPFQPVELRPL
jgi:hypothetical protein